jgi:hypothetical protein
MHEVRHRRDQAADDRLALEVTLRGMTVISESIRSMLADLNRQLSARFPGSEALIDESRGPYESQFRVTLRMTVPLASKFVMEWSSTNFPALHAEVRHRLPMS